MGGMNVRKLVVVGVALGVLAAWPGAFPGPFGGPGVAVAADALNIENLPKDPKAFRAQVTQIIGKVDGLIAKLKDNKEAEAALMDLMQTRDNVLREVSKVENTPDGSKWTADQMVNSVGAMLKLLKNHYDKAAEKAG